MVSSSRDATSSGSRDSGERRIGIMELDGSAGRPVLSQHIWDDAFSAFFPTHDDDHHDVATAIHSSRDIIDIKSNNNNSSSINGNNNRITQMGQSNQFISDNIINNYYNINSDVNVDIHNGMTILPSIPREMYQINRHSDGSNSARPTTNESSTYNYLLYVHCEALSEIDRLKKQVTELVSDDGDDDDYDDSGDDNNDNYGYDDITY